MKNLQTSVTTHSFKTSLLKLGATQCLSVFVQNSPQPRPVSTATRGQAWWSWWGEIIVASENNLSDRHDGKRAGTCQTKLWAIDRGGISWISASRNSVHSRAVPNCACGWVVGWCRTFALKKAIEIHMRPVGHTWTRMVSNRTHLIPQCTHLILPAFYPFGPKFDPVGYKSHLV